MRQALEYAVDLKILEFNPFSQVKIDGGKMFRRVPKPRSETQVFNMDELQSWHETAWNDFYSRKYHKHQLIPLALMFFFQTGLRISEICAVRYEDIENGQLHIQRMYSSYDHTVKEKTKGLFGDRIIPLTDDALYLIQKAKEHQQEEGVSNTEYIFSMTCQPLPYSGLSKAFRHTCINSNILQAVTKRPEYDFITLIKWLNQAAMQRPYSGWI